MIRTRRYSIACRRRGLCPLACFGDDRLGPSQMPQDFIEGIPAHDVQMLVLVSVPPFDAVDDGRFVVAPRRPGNVY